MPNLPSGTVAFLFTDIEGSTRLWERDPVAMRQALERHNAILGAAIAAHDGVHYKTIGDAFQAAFPNVTAAIAAAVAAQRGLAAEPWPETGPLLVRMAIHAGEATPTSNERPDYLAPALNRLARLLAAGHGGQVLLSNTARALAGGMPDGCGLRDLGQHRLRDLLEPEQIWQLLIAGLPDTFPPPRTLESGPTNLPLQATPLVGREAELAAVLPMLTAPETRLLTLTGPGGVGKTRLSVQLAADALDEFPDGAFFIDLAGVTTPDAVLPLIAEVLGVREGGGLTLPEATLALLAPRRLLLLLDNLEQIRPAEELGRLLADLLAAAPRVTVLATSRAPLRIRAEREWPLAPLATPDPARLLPPEVLAGNPAVALFMERAQAARPSLTLTPANAAAVAEIVHRLDGLPLAMELAAARLRALSPNELRDRLGQQLDLLFGPAADRPDRQQTLRATMRWSHALLTPEAQTLFRRLGVFAGGFTLEAAEDVGGDGFAVGGDGLRALGGKGGQGGEGGKSGEMPDSALLSAPLLPLSPLSAASPPTAKPSPPTSVLDSIEELLAESLLRAEETASGELRYRMLETIRAYAIERLAESGETEAARAAHLDWLTRWADDRAQGLLGEERAATLDRFEAEHANLRAALGWTLESGRASAGLALAARAWKFWQFRAHLSDGRSWLERLLQASPEEPTADRATGFEAAGVLAWNLGDLSASRALLEQSVALFRNLRDESGLGRSLNNLGNVLNLMGDLVNAEALFEKSLAIARALGDARQEGTTLNNLALIAMDRGELDRSRALLEASLAIKQRIGARGEMAIVLGNLALIATLHDDLPRAITLFEDGLAIEREIGNPVGTADALGNLAEVLAMCGQLARSMTLHRESLLLRQEIGDSLSLPYSLESIATAAVSAGLPAPAVRLLAASHALRDATSAPIPETSREQYQRTIARATETLGEAAYAERWREGLQLSLDVAVAEALALCDAVAERATGADTHADSAVTSTPAAVSELPV